MVSHPMSRRRMALWCATLAAGLLFSAALCLARGPLRAGQALRADTLRLHIRAASDRPADQTAKLAVRDAVLARADADCPAALAAAQRWAAGALPALELAARQQLARLGLEPAARAELVEMYFSAAHYPGASLPAGRYRAVRLTLGSNANSGRNWWCVLYPGLCRSACGGYASPAENELVCGQYRVRFWLVDRVQALCASRRDVTLLSPGA